MPPDIASVDFEEMTWVPKDMASPSQPKSGEIAEDIPNASVPFS